MFAKKLLIISLIINDTYNKLEFFLFKERYLKFFPKMINQKNLKAYPIFRFKLLSLFK